MNNVRACENCRYHRTYGQLLPDRCVEPSSAGYFMPAKLQREDNDILARFHGTCGQRGRFFIAKGSHQTSYNEELGLMLTILTLLMVCGAAFLCWLMLSKAAGL